MSNRINRFLVAGALTASAFAPAALSAQSTAAATDSLAFPRQFVKWVFSAQGESAFAHAAPALQESMKSAQSINEMAGRIQTRFGDRAGKDTEVQFDEGALKVYIVAIPFSQAPEPGAWVVAYSPATRIVERASFSPLSRVKANYPQAKLP